MSVPVVILPPGVAPEQVVIFFPDAREVSVQNGLAHAIDEKARRHGWQLVSVESVSLKDTSMRMNQPPVAYVATTSG
jgi:hypothetical protein